MWLCSHCCRSLCMTSLPFQLMPTFLPVQKGIPSQRPCSPLMVILSCPSKVLEPKQYSSGISCQPENLSSLSILLKNYNIILFWHWTLELHLHQLQSHIVHSPPHLEIALFPFLASWPWQLNPNHKHNWSVSSKLQKHASIYKEWKLEAVYRLPSHKFVLN